MKKAKFVLLLATLLVSAVAFGQVISGDINGTVVDKSGAVVPNATVDAVNQATSVKSSTTTNANGEYHISNLPAGTYDITATAKGFGSKTLKGFLVELNKTNTARISMDLGQVATTVEVTDVAPSVDTTTANVQTTYEEKQLTGLPTGALGSGVLNLSLLDSGVASSGGVGAGSGPSIGGQRPRNNNFTVEGVDNNSKSVTGPLIVVPSDAVSNLTVLQNQFSPEFGHSTGGQFNQVVQSGTNRFHGKAYEYFQNRNLNAVNQSNANQGIFSNPRYDNNRFGGNLGGPILKNKLFFFADYEYNPIGQASNPSSAVFTPTAAGYTTLAGLAGVSATNLAILKQFATPAASASGPPIIVAGKPVQVGVLSIVAPNFSNTNALVTSGDWNISDHDQLRIRYLYNSFAGIDTASTLPIFYTALPNINHLATISEYHTFSASVNNELRLGFNRNVNSVDAGNFSFPGLDQFPNLTFDELNLQLGPDPNGPQFGIQNTYQIVDNVSWVKGNHSFKFGWEGRKYISPQSFTQRSRGDYEYSTLDLYLRDLTPDTLGERSTGNVVYYGDQIGLYGYANDTWRIRPNISLNIGMRYEYTTIPFTERLQRLNKVADVPGVLTFNEPRAPKKDFMPRVGFAWSPGSSGNTSVRGGFGMGYDVLYDNIGILSLPPQVGTTVDVDLSSLAPNFLKNGGIKGGGSGFQVLDRATAIANTANHVVENVLYPYSIQWNLGVQHSFAKNYTLEVRYLGSRGVHLNTQSRINVLSKVDATHFLPTFTTAPSQATLNALTTTLTQLQARPRINPAFSAAGFTGNIVQFTPNGGSIYHGLATQLNRRFSNGLLFQTSYTWSHLIDNSTADFFTTFLTPRRPQDFQNIGADRSSSALDRRHRVTVSLVYDTQWFKNSNWVAKNVLGNWEIAPIYTFESPEWGDVQSASDANLNGDSAGDRVIINPTGVKGTGTGVTALKNSAGATVAYLANNSNAYFIRAGAGALATSGRSTLALPHINNWDLAMSKRFAITERFRLEFGAQLLNAFNHPQFVPGSLNDIASVGQAGTAALNLMNPASNTFNNPRATFSSNPRAIQLALKFVF